MAKIKNPNSYERNDQGNAKLFRDFYKNDLRFDSGEKQWMVWKEHWFQPIEASELMAKVITMVERRKHYALTLEQGDKTKGEISWCVRSGMLAHLKAVPAIARELSPFTTNKEDWNQDRLSLGVNGGVVDLRTGELRKGTRGDLISRFVGIKPDAAVPCPNWKRCLTEWMPSYEERAFLGRAIGYTLTGSVEEQVIFILTGRGSNGKSEFLNVLRHIFGDYAISTPAGTLEENRDSHSNALARMEGKRFICSVETDEHKVLDAARLKAISGGDEITGRYLYNEFNSFESQGKIWLSTNQLPRVNDPTDGFWRRVRIINFPNKFSPPLGERSKSGRGLLWDKLESELPGILNWAIGECVRWQAAGLVAPDSVTRAVQEYRMESDTLGLFLDEECRVDSGTETDKQSLLDAYKSWAKRGNFSHTYSRVGFAREMKARGFQERRDKDKRYWTGVRLVHPMGSVEGLRDEPVILPETLKPN